ncbi:MAG: hypothetical protein ACYCU0_05425 [Solirubrobacteraceae bacterium]
MAVRADRFLRGGHFMQPIRTDFTGYEGKFVAIDARTGEVVLADEDPATATGAQMSDDNIRSRVLGRAAVMDGAEVSRPARAPSGAWTLLPTKTANEAGVSAHSGQRANIGHVGGSPSPAVWPESSLSVR